MMRTVTLHRGGKPITAGEMPSGSTITFDCFTGEVLAIRKPRKRNARKRNAARRGRRRPGAGSR